MTSQLETVAAGISTICSAVFGSKLLPALANAVPVQLPDWMSWLLGPLGALIGMIFAVWWLAARLNRAEQKADAREAARDTERTAVIVALTENTAVIREVKEVIGRCKGNHAP